MAMTELTIELAAMPVTVKLNNEKAALYFRDWPVSADNGKITVSVSPELLEQKLAQCRKAIHPGIAELSALVYALSEKMLPYGRCFFHGTVLKWHGLAWIFTGPSGIGKTTQYRLWHDSLGDEASLLCGDRSVIQLCPDGSLLVHATPWNGKEGFRVKPDCAPLGGMICLVQGTENDISLMTGGDVVSCLFRQFMFVPSTREKVYQVAEILDAAMKKVPVWKFVNDGKSASVAVGMNAVQEYIENAGLL